MEMWDDLYEAIHSEQDKWIESEKKINSPCFSWILTEESFTFKDHKEPDYLALHQQ